MLVWRLARLSEMLGLDVQCKHPFGRLRRRSHFFTPPFKPPPELSKLIVAESATCQQACLLVSRGYRHRAFDGEKKCQVYKRSAARLFKGSMTVGAADNQPGLLIQLCFRACFDIFVTISTCSSGIKPLSGNLAT